MCVTVFNEKESVWFVGGRGNGLGASDDRGGCTKEWWDNQPDKAAAMAKLMTNNGGPIVSLTNVPYTGDDEDTIYSEGAFEDVEVGMVAFVIQDGDPDEDVATGRYEITAVTDDEITLAGINGSDCDLDINIGGAFEDLALAIDETSAGSHSVTIYTNLNETVGSGITLTSGGSQPGNTFKRIIGYNTIPGDMSRGEAYYESPLEILQNGSIDSSKCVTFDGNGGTFDILTISGYSDNYIFENLHLTGLTSTGRGIAFSNVSDSVVFRNCRFSDMYQVVNSEADHLMFQDCYSHDDMANHSYVLHGLNNLLSGCVANLPAGAVLTNIVSVPAAVIGCITVGGMYAVRPVSAGAAALVIGNTFYNTAEYGIVADTADSVVAFNNIFCLAPGAIGIYCRNGPIVYNDHNCFIESDGTPLTATGTEYSGGEAPVMGPHSVQVDPDFVDAANGDFRVRNPAVLRGGRPGPDGRAAVIGAIGQEYQFAERARVMNAGRAGIIR